MKKFFVIFLIIIIFFCCTAHAATVTTFVYPDNTDIIDKFVAEAQELKIAVYTYDDAQLTLPKNTTLIVEKSPVGGLNNKWLLCALQRSGVNVYLYDGALRYMHAKYMIKGSNVLVSTENIGSNNRGWGIIVDDAQISETYEKIFADDLKDSKKLVCDGEEKKDLKRKEHISHFSLKTYNDQETEAIFVPGAEERIIELLSNAKQKIYVQQFYIYKLWDKKDNPFLQKIIEKAQQGIEVKILLDSTYYNKDSNGEVIEYINDIAEKEKLRMEARYIENTYFEKSHAKGLIVDNTVLVSSINWNDNSVRNNREAGVIIRGDASSYFTNTFLADWNSNYDLPKTGAATANYSIIIGIFVLIIFICIFAYFLWKRKRLS